MCAIVAPGTAVTWATLNLAGAPPAGAVVPSTTVYVYNNDTHSITSYPATASGDVAPTQTLHPATAGQGTSLAFDARGNLWVGTTTKNTVLEFSATQLAAGGTQTPAIVISGLTEPDGLAYDGAGDLWIAERHDSRLAELLPTQLAASGAPTPTVTVSSDSATPPSLYYPSQLAFDSGGDLWVANNGDTTVVEEFHPGRNWPPVAIRRPP